MNRTEWGIIILCRAVRQSRHRTQATLRVYCLFLPDLSRTIVVSVCLSSLTSSFSLALAVRRSDSRAATLVLSVSDKHPVDTRLQTFFFFTLHGVHTLMEFTRRKRKDKKKNNIERENSIGLKREFLEIQIVLRSILFLVEGREGVLRMS